MTRAPSSLIILGASGDLTARLLLPGLAQLLAMDPDRELQLIGLGGVPLSAEAWEEKITSSFATVEGSGKALKQVLGSTRYVEGDATDAATLASLIALCDQAPALYFALPPAVAEASCDALATIDLPAGITLALEKPFGTDEASAIALNSKLQGIVPENQIHRVDHFLGRSTVFNILGLRFANRIFEPLWNSEHIEKVDVIYDEQLGLEGRAGYYDKAGALVDMIQSHLLQVLAVLVMEPPSTLGAEDLRDAKEIVLRATRIKDGDPVAASRRARYTAGAVDGRELPAYETEEGVDPNRHTETLAELTLEVNTWRWAGVPFTLRSGKALAERRREIVVTFKQPNRVPAGLLGPVEPTVLRIFLAPDKMALELNINGPGDPYELERVQLDAEFGEGQLLAYREVLAGILDADPTLSVRGDSAVDCWSIVEPALAAWRANAVALDEYSAGSSGPDSWKPLG